MTFDRDFQDKFFKSDNLAVRADEKEIEFETMGSARYVFLGFDEVEELREFLTEWLEEELPFNEPRGCGG